MIKLLLLALVFFLGYSLLSSIFRSLGAPRPRGQTPGAPDEGESMVKDPVCGTFVPRRDALKLGSGAQTRYFCSTECRERFKKGDFKDP